MACDLSGIRLAQADDAALIAAVGEHHAHQPQPQAAEAEAEADHARLAAVPPGVGHGDPAVPLSARSSICAPRVADGHDLQLSACRTPFDRHARDV
jgi:hypothetical protein